MNSIIILNYEESFIESDDVISGKITLELEDEVKNLNNNFTIEIEKIINAYQNDIEVILKKNNIAEGMGLFIDTNERVIYRGYKGNSQYNTYDIYSEINDFINFKEIKPTTEIVNNIFNYVMEEIKRKGTVLNFGWEAYKTDDDIIMDLYTLDIEELNNIITKN